MSVAMSVADAHSSCARTMRPKYAHICIIAANDTSNFDRLKLAEQKPFNRTRFCVGEKRGFGQVSSVYGQSEPDRNPDTYVNGTDVRAASENTPFLGHVTWTEVKTPPVEST